MTSTLFLFSIVTFAQTLKISSGVFYSSLDIGNSDFYDEKITSIPIMVGLNYLEKKNYYLSSEIGYMKVGGEDLIYMTDDPLNGYSEQKKETFDVIQLNTTFRYKIPLKDDFHLFIGAGPKLDFFLTRKFENYPLNILNYEMPSTIFGLLSEIGATYDINKISVGFVGRYNINIKNDIYNYQIFGLSISLGYHL